jgi:hypothetical protein
MPQPYPCHPWLLFAVDSGFDDLIPIRIYPRPLCLTLLTLHFEESFMACDPKLLHDVPLFATMDSDELAVLAGQVELRQFAARQRIFRIGEPGDRAYILLSGAVRVTVADEDNQEIVLQEPGPGDFFGFASMLE